MSQKTKILKGSFLVTLTGVVTYACGLARNMIFARILTKADFGVVATIAIMMSMFEWVSKMGIGQLVMQAKEGDTPRFLAVAHWMQFVTGVLSGVVIFLAATPVAIFFNISEQTWTLRMLALLPLLRGLEHLHILRLVRDMKYVPAMLAEIIPQIAITLAAWPVTEWLNDARAVLLLLLFKTALTDVMAHWYGAWNYRWAFERRHIQAILKFGWPLVLNGLLWFPIFQGDRVLVGHFYSMSDLGIYAAAATLALAPVEILGLVMNSVMLPVLSKRQDDRAGFRSQYRLAVELTGVVSAIYGIFFILGSEVLMVLVFGKKYVGGAVVLAWFAASGAFRMLRAAPTGAALALGDSKNPMISNVFRTLGFFPALLAVLYGQPLWAIAAAAVVGEVCACVASFWQLSHRHKVPGSASMKAVILTSAIVTLSGLGTWIGLYQPQGPVSLIVVFIGCAITIMVGLLFLPGLRSESLAGLQSAEKWPLVGFLTTRFKHTK